MGDMIDRGPQSKEVVEWFMKNGRAILGNHEHMMLDHIKNKGSADAYYGPGIWIWNGGQATIDSYGGVSEVPINVVEWMKGLPLYLEVDGHLISHSFVPPGMTLEEACDLGDAPSNNDILWCRRPPERVAGYKTQIVGHNSQFGLQTWSDDEGIYSYCLDDSSKRKLTGIHLPTMKIYQQDYID